MFKSILFIVIILLAFALGFWLVKSIFLSLFNSNDDSNNYKPSENHYHEHKHLNISLDREETSRFLRKKK